MRPTITEGLIVLDAIIFLLHFEIGIDRLH